MVQVWVKPLTFPRFELDLEDGWKVQDVKQKIAEIKGLDAAAIKLLFGGRELEDSKFISEVRIRENDHLILLTRLSQQIDLPLFTSSLAPMVTEPTATVPSSSPLAASPAATTPSFSFVAPSATPQPQSQVAPPTTAQPTAPTTTTPTPPVPMPIDIQQMILDMVRAFPVQAGGTPGFNPFVQFGTAPTTATTPTPAPTTTATTPAPTPIFPFPVPMATSPTTTPTIPTMPTAPTPTGGEVEPQLPPLPPEQVQLLVEVGFPEERVKKALYLCKMNAEAAMEWLLMHSEDPDVDEPFTPAQKRQLAQYYAPAATIDPRVQQAIKANVCTYAVTGPKYAAQNWYHCYTCNLSGNEGCCEVCARVCHRGHHLSRQKYSAQFFCDCGASVHSFRCRAMRVAAPSTAAIASSPTSTTTTSSDQSSQSS
jgi:hypothetical protein